ncbi:hypothetical protein J4460_06800 [Candidatus Woesearchaeota archaeon]|nr:MAG: hypothetical protein QS99_C0018G0009 [archaeon GW2011_AR4]MBS3130348.1 hypothetical protein [Candidatus Woesearchaeota archaeon]HIH37400.1 hypothetical protein [Candidatus Woesearchaeota archaeon]HIH49562.1 hypothetical protein [Candidatus Woesearchaeota archaeon]HIJ04201.1 hypothetical protein [Candidatus Woesearchaeota archaeon]
MNNKGELSLAMIVGFIIAAVILIIILVFINRNAGEFSRTGSDCATFGGTCEPPKAACDTKTGEGCECTNGFLYKGSSCTEEKICCVTLKS